MGVVGGMVVGVVGGVVVSGRWCGIGGVVMGWQ